MTEKEYLLEMLCCLPKKMLLLRVDNSDELPKWLCKIDDDVIIMALENYDDEYYKMQREEMMKYL